jgi:hypothetical protein
MEWSDYEIKIARKEVIRLTSLLLEARRRMYAATEKANLISGHGEICQIIQENCVALTDGLLETVKLCGIVATDFQSKIKDPTTTVPRSSHFTSLRATPFQRQLMREGVKLDALPEFEPSKREARAPRILKFTLKTPKRKRRRSTKDNIPL